MLYIWKRLYTSPEESVRTALAAIDTAMQELTAVQKELEGGEYE